jgi:hypothetical protein
MVDRNRIFSRALSTALFLAASQFLSASVVFQFPLPTTNLNQAAGSNRSNASFSANSGDYAGQDFTLTTSAVINSLTVYVVANSPTSGTIDTLGQEFTSISLYEGASTNGTSFNPATLAATQNTAQLNAAPRVYYTGTTDYQTLNSGTTFFPMYSVTFTGLNWFVPSGQDTYFLVGDTPVGGNSLFLSASTIPDPNSPLYSAFMEADSGFNPIGFDGCYSGPNQTGGQTTEPCTSTSIPNFNTNLAVVNFIASTPEPSTFGFLGLALAGFALKLRRK